MQTNGRILTSLAEDLVIRPSRVLESHDEDDDIVIIRDISLPTLQSSVLLTEGSPHDDNKYKCNRLTLNNCF